MRIDSYSIGMESARSYKTSTRSVMRFAITDYTADAATSGFGGNNSLPGESEAADASGTSLVTDTGDNAKVISRDSIESLRDRINRTQRDYQLRSSEETNAQTIKQMTVLYLLELLFADRQEKLRELKEKLGIGTEGSFDVASQMQTPTSITTYTADYYHYEEESVSFRTTGTVRCSDGREINFNVNVGMSRSFEEYIGSRTVLQTVHAVDPLVINLNGSVAEVSDQTFFFDLDCDGAREEISQLGGGSGMLALDRNGNGIIDDGSELFGTRTGNGFEELAVYDDDGDGWIDEDDDVWSKLQIWTKDADGKDSLVSLKEAGVGAICLGNVGTQFSLTDMANNTNAFVRSTGLFLYENGAAGTVQQLDLVSYRKEA